MRRFLMTGLFYLLSPFHPIFLDTLQHHKMEKARKLAQQYNMKAVQMMRKCRSIKKQLVTFIKIELGSNHINLTFNFALCLASCFMLLSTKTVLKYLFLIQFFYRTGGVLPGDCSDPHSSPVQNKDSYDRWTHNNL